jgi:hypothetical protein
MKLTRATKLLLKIGGIVLSIEFVVVVIVAMIGFWSGWQNLEEFQNAIQIAGLLQFGAGFLGIKGNWEVTRSFEYQYSMSTIDQSSWERTQQTLVDFAQSYAFMLVMFMSGGISLLIGWLL